jgi:Ca-activated chloride channel family protein
MMQQKDSAAIVQYQNAGKMETNKIRKAKVYHNIGVVCQKHQMFGDAIKAYEESLRNNPNDNETRYNLALCKRQQKNQKQKGGGGDNKKNNKNKNNKDKQNKNQKNDKNKDQNKQEKQPKEQMSKENAEQLLNAAVQEEKATQQRLKKAMQMPRRKQLQEEW